MADSKRGGRSDDDEFDGAESADLEEFDDDDEADDDLDEDADGDTATMSRGRTAAKTARSKATTRPKKKAASKDDGGPSLIGRFLRFVREVVAELQKVIWPTRKELLTYTTVVVVFVAIMMTVVALLDLGFAKVMFVVFGGATTTGTTGQ